MTRLSTANTTIVKLGDQCAAQKRPRSSTVARAASLRPKVFIKRPMRDDSREGGAKNNVQLPRLDLLFRGDVGQLVHSVPFHRYLGSRCSEELCSCVFQGSVWHTEGSTLADVNTGGV